MEFDTTLPGSWLAVAHSIFALLLLPMFSSAIAGVNPQFSALQTASLEGQTEQYGWQPEFYGAGVAGTVYAMTTYQGKLVFAGDFQFGGASEYNGIAIWDGFELSPVAAPTGVGVDGTIHALAVFNGHLIAGGVFNQAGGVDANNIAQWDGQNWSALGQGTTGQVYALTVYEQELIAGGQFLAAGGETVNNIASWNGSGWSVLAGASGIGTNSRVHSLTTYNDELIAGGTFFQAGGNPVNRIARWDGSDWYPLTGPEGTGTNGTVLALREFNSELIVGGDFSYTGSINVRGVARWNGTRWAELAGCCGHGVSGSVRALEEFNGTLVVGGHFDVAGGGLVDNIARWTGTQWLSMAGPAGPGRYEVVHALAGFDNELMVGAGVSIPENPPNIRGIVRWDGYEWLQLSGTGSSGLFNTAFASVIYQDQLVVGGDFETAGKLVVNHIAQWDGELWNALGAGVNFEVRALATDGNTLVAAGTTFVADRYRTRVAAWNGTEWTELPELTASQHSSARAAVFFNGMLIVGGDFTHAGSTLVNNIAMWDGDQWQALQTGQGIGTNGKVAALFVHNDELIVGGSFGSAGGQAVSRIARWTGNTWLPLQGGGVTGFGQGVTSLVSIDGDLFVGGWFNSAGGAPASNIARWDGGAWHALGEGIGNIMVHALGAWEGELIVGGRFYTAGGESIIHIARWDGLDWIALTNANGVGMPPTGSVHTILALGDSVRAGGRFDAVGGSPSWNMSRFTLEPTEVEIVDRSPETSDIGESVQIVARVQGTIRTPESARGTIYSSSGESCTTLQLVADGETSSTFTCSLELMSGGLHELSATFSASPTHNRSDSDPVPHLVRTSSQTSITGLDPTVSQLAGQPFEISVEVNGASDPAGSVDIGNGSAVLCTIILPGDRCTIIIDVVGPLTLHADYSGDSIHGPSSDSVAYGIMESSLMFSPNPLQFGAIGIGQTSEPKSITISNTSELPVSIDNLTLPAGSAYWQSGGTCGTPSFTLPAGTECTFDWVFAPTQAGQDQVIVDVQSDRPEGPHVFFLNGNGMDEILQDRFEQM